MFSGYYTAASGILTHQRQIDVIGNNLVNQQTPGYRAERLVISSFNEELLRRQEGANSGDLSPSMATTAVVDRTDLLSTTGLIKSTGRSLDVAINGNGYYNIQGTDGNTYLTRNGQFDIDTEGYLTLPGYGRVLGESGAIKVTNENFSVQPDGTVLGSDGTQLGKILVTIPAQDAVMTKLANGMFQSVAGTAGTSPADFTLEQSSLELSNGDMQTEMTNLIAAQRGFQSCSSALQIVDNMNQKAASELASLN